MTDEEVQKIKKVLGQLIAWLQLELGTENTKKLLEMLHDNEKS